MNENILRSPLFYVGDKYKLMPQLKELFPSNIDVYIEPFAGGGSSFINTSANKYLINDLDSHVIELHAFLSEYSNKKNDLFKLLFSIIKKYNLSCSYLNNNVPDILKKEYPKTYFSKYNKEAYKKLKYDYNKKHNPALLYVLLIYGFNHMIRFNKSGEFNLPVGNVDFNMNVYNALDKYIDFVSKNNVKLYNEDFAVFLKKIKINNNSFVFFDPPYFISNSEYNKYWSINEEIRLCTCIDELDKKGVRFGITNLVRHKGKVNDIFLEWSQKYKVYSIDSNYISFNDNSIKNNSREVYVTNYG